MDTSPFDPDTILIRQRGKAHRPGCQHNDEDRIRSGEDEGWGWVREATPEQWLRISPENPLHATDGYTLSAATERCSHCS